MAERQIEHRKSSLVLSARFPVVKWRSRSVAKSASTVEDGKQGSTDENICVFVDQQWCTQHI